MKLAIKIDIDTLLGTRDGIAELSKVLLKHGASATFLFSFGPDNTGKAIRRVFKKGFLKKCFRSNVAGNYGLKTLMYGTLLPAPVISKKCAAQIKKIYELGFECGVHSWDHFKWQDHLFAMRPTEVEAEFLKASAEFEKIMGSPPETCGAPGWQISPEALKVEDDQNLLYASDTRGTHPFFPRMGGRTFKTLQIPTTLPTLDEMLGQTPLEKISEKYFEEMQKSEHSVMTIHSELEGMKYLKWFDSFLEEAKSRGVEFFNLKEWAKELLKNPENIPSCEIEMLPFPGRYGNLAQQAAKK